MHTSSYKNMKWFVAKYLEQSRFRQIKILDVGSQDVNSTYRPLFDNSNWQYTGWT